MNLIHAVWRRWLSFAFAVGVATPLRLAAQQPAPASAPGQPSPPPAAAQLPPYRPPTLALVQPAAGGSVPQDRPVVVLRFAAGEPNDPIDARSFAISVNGVDRAPLYQVAAAGAWGPLANASDSTVALGAHRLTARICSVRGACAEVAAVVAVIEPSAASSVAPDTSPVTRRRKVLDAVVSTVRKPLEL